MGKILKLVLDYIFGTIYLLYFGLLLVIFHPIQWLAFNFGPAGLHQKTVVWLNFFIVRGWILAGCTSCLKNTNELPSNQTMIFVSNHQSMFDIPGIIWYLRKYTPLFVSKIELAKGVPSISYNLRVGHAALIDRQDPRQAISEIIKFANYIKSNAFCGVIFPEGTRSRTGKLRPFAVGGLATLIKKCPDALIVPIAIQNTGKFNPTGMFPLKTFIKMSWTTLEPISSKNKTPEEVCEEAESQIGNFLAKF